MKYIKLFTLLLFFANILNAEYLRTIRIGSFQTPQNAKKELNKLNNFSKKHKNIKKLQKKWDFKLTYRKSGSYYVTVIEPLRDRKVLQEVLDTVRIKYKDAYVTRLTKAPVVKKKVEKIKPVKIEKPKPVVKKPEPVVVKKEIVKVEPIQKIVEPVKKIEKIVVKEKSKPVEEIKKIEKVQKVEKKIKKKEQVVISKVESSSENQYIWKILFVLTLLLLILLVLLLRKTIIKLKSYESKEVQNADTMLQVYEEIKNKKGFLDLSKSSMVSIIDFTNLLLEFELTTIQRDYVKRIISTSGNLLNTINNTLDLNKIIDNKLKIEDKEFDFNKVLNDVSNVVSLEAKNNNLIVYMKVDDDVPAYVSGDPVRLKQVLINLLGNSTRFTKDGDVTLSVKNLYSYINAVTIGFTISDTGSGITDEQAKEILHSNPKTIDTTDLTVSKTLIEMMNGEMKMYNTPDVGTTFTFHIKFNVRPKIYV